MTMYYSYVLKTGSINKEFHGLNFQNRWSECTLVSEEIVGAAVGAGDSVPHS